MTEPTALPVASTPRSVSEPVAGLANVSDPREPEDGIGLALSGGGYRAMLFHLGALWRLNELGFLPKLDRISSVSGGSITAGVLGLAWGRLAFNDAGIAENFAVEVVGPIRRLASTTVDIPAVLLGWLGLSAQFFYRRILFGNATLQDLPDRPRFVINASNVQSGVLWRFSKPYIWDYRVGQIKSPKTPLAVAVAASSAFPPVLSPVTLRFRPGDFEPETGTDLQVPPYTSKAVLTDGGVYDNLGLETVWKRYRTVLVSDGGERPRPQPSPRGNWVSHTARVIPLIHNQISSIRRRQLIDSYRSTDPAARRFGAYWGVGADITEYPADGPLPCPYAQTRALAAVSTRLYRMSDSRQRRLINWGYAVCDAAMRGFVVKVDCRPTLPYPDARISA